MYNLQFFLSKKKVCCHRRFSANPSSCKINFQLISLIRKSKKLIERRGVYVISAPEVLEILLYRLSPCFFQKLVHVLFTCDYFDLFPADYK